MSHDVCKYRCLQAMASQQLSVAHMRVTQKSASFLSKPAFHAHDGLSLHAASQPCDKAIDRNATYLE